MKVKAIVGLVSFAIIASAGGLFFVQNATRTTQLSFDLGAVAWQLSGPVSLPLLMTICAVGGLAVGVIFLTPKTLKLAGQVRRLERQVALSDQSSDEWPTS